MRRKLLALVVLAAVIGAGVFWIVTIPAIVPASALAPRAADAANGREMFYAGGCAACHATPDQDDRTRLGGGLGLKSPFGTFYAPNISPDPNDGIGNWSEAVFVTAMLKGTSPDGRHYFPAFPYTSYQRMRLDDVRDLFAHLKTLPKVAGKVRAHDVPFPFNLRRLIGGWKLLFLDGRPFEPDASKSAAWNRGAYLVNGPGHCAECHSPRNVLGGIVRAQVFAGGPNPEGKGWVPNITQLDLKDYSEKDFAYLLETGNTPEGDSVGGAMAPVIRNTAQLTEADRAAMATYLKSLPAVEGPKPPQGK
ncbi:MAG TPA: cytochrome c [Xanthobacteraceae bacterium]|nr:cytochrome c [Xanthobacteraceae bacterium]